jgi:DNA-directed RNA polymerase subunit RPC12/RpoP
MEGLVDCLECGVKIAYDAVVCPHCGTRKTHKARKEADDKAMIFLIGVPFMFVVWLFSLFAD